ncbi:MAG: hypothetical protein SPG64_01795 [Candidatus Enteromonas sp.]|nr:hypothetical protein [Candidatus Enteromonas sp.]
MDHITEEERDIEITREDGIVEHFRILFTFRNDERGKDYYFLYKPEEEDTLICLSSIDGETFEYLSDEEQDEAEQVLDAYNEDPLIEEIRE